MAELVWVCLFSKGLALSINFSARMVPERDFEKLNAKCQRLRALPRLPRCECCLQDDRWGFYLGPVSLWKKLRSWNGEVLTGWQGNTNAHSQQSRALTEFKHIQMQHEGVMNIQRSGTEPQRDATCLKPDMCKNKTCFRDHCQVRSCNTFEERTAKKITAATSRHGPVYTPTSLLHIKLFKFAQPLLSFFIKKSRRQTELSGIR